MAELWKPILIEGLEGLEVSSLGNFKKGKRNISTYKDNKGYLIVRKQTNGIRKCYLAHRVVALTFIPNPENKLEVNHIDGDKTNNCIDNLEWTTRLENQRHAIEVLGVTRTNRSGKPKKKVLQLLGDKVIGQYESVHDAARETNSDYSKIAMVCRGERKTHNGFKWTYEMEGDDL